MSPRRWLHVGCAMNGGVLAVSGASAAAHEAADLLLYNGKMLAVDKTFSIATAIRRQEWQDRCPRLRPAHHRRGGPAKMQVDLTIIGGKVVHDRSAGGVG